MGVTIPLPELDLPRPAQNPAPDPLSEFARASQLRTQAAQQGLIQQQTQGVSQQNDMQAMQLKDEQLRRSLAPKYVQKDEEGKPTGFDNEGLYSEMLSQGADPLTVQSMRMKNAEMQKTLIGLSDAQIEHQNKINDTMYEGLESIRDINKKSSTPSTGTPSAVSPQPVANAQPNSGGQGPLQSLANPPTPGSVPTQGESVQQVPSANVSRPITPEAQAAYQKQLIRLHGMGIPVGQLKPVLTDEADLDQAEASLGLHKQQLNEAKETAQTQEAAGKAKESEAKAGAENWKGSDGVFWNLKTGQVVHAGGNPSQQAFQEYVAQGGDPLQFSADQAARTARTELPGKIALVKAEAAARQAVADGDPVAAGKLLFDGDVAPSQLISSRKPAFAQQSFDAAKNIAQEQGKSWNAQEAEGFFKVAQSPTNVAFFGSAKSLTDKGGTLDQLAAAGKDIPQNEFPVFNTVADAIKASTGSGPVAKYAAIALGVADDYAKVMGGGQGSDTSRTQALNIIAAKQSPEQRAASIEGIRGAVGSQTKSRIGNNPVLKKMYGSELSEPSGQSGSTSGKAVSLAAAKALPINQGKTDDQIRADIEAHGHKVAP